MLHLPGGFPPISNRGVATDSYTPPDPETIERHEWTESDTGRRVYLIQAIHVVNGQRIGRTLESGYC